MKSRNYSAVFNKIKLFLLLTGILNASQYVLAQEKSAINEKFTGQVATNVLIREGSPNDQFELGKAYMEGKGVNRDYEKAGYWFRLAAERGNPIAMNALGSLYCDGKGVTHDYKAAEDWFLKSAAKNEPRAYYNLARMNEQGLGVTINLPKAVNLYQQSADLGFARAQIKLGEGYFFADLGLSKDYKKAFSQFSAASSSGDPFAENYMGVMYLQGLGVDPNVEKARAFFRASAKQGCARAQKNMGDLYIHKGSTTEDFHKAALWYLSLIHI